SGVFDRFTLTEHIRCLETFCSLQVITECSSTLQSVESRTSQNQHREHAVPKEHVSHFVRY
ncbi:hypothetical protein BaRGS_00032105, partial [Batillaria attramentaria]